MLAIYSDEQFNHEVKEADKYIKQVFKDAMYYCETKYGVLAFTPLSDKKQFDKDGNETNTYYTINGKKYDSCYSNSYKELVKFYDTREVKEPIRKVINKPEQLTLF